MSHHRHEGFSDQVEANDSTPYPTTYDQERQNRKIHEAINIAIFNVNDARDLVAKQAKQREHEYKREMDGVEQEYQRDMALLKEERNRLNQLHDSLTLLKTQPLSLFVRER